MGLAPRTTPLGRGMKAADLAQRLKKARGRNGKWEACCPAHEDQTPSLSLTDGRDGRILLHCHAGCPTDAILGAMGLSLADLFNEAAPVTTRREPAVTYDYTDADGRLLFQVCRYQPKAFNQRRPDGRGGWLWGLGDTPRNLFRLPLVHAAIQTGETVYVVEGEKDALTVSQWGLVGTTNPMGADNWKDLHAQQLTGAHVVIVPDNDEKGKKHGHIVRDSLLTLAASVYLAPPLPGAKDVTEWAAKGGTKAKFLQHCTPEAPYYYLTDLFQRPELLEPPPVIIPRLAWAGRVTLLAAREKVGKSTIMGQATAALASAPTEFLGGNIPGPGKTLWIGIDEPLGDIVRRLDRYQLNVEHLARMVAVRNARPGALELAEWIAREQFTLVVLDHLTAYGLGRVADGNRASDYTPIMQELSTVARETNCALVALHHSAKGGGYRDSTAIGAQVDAIITMKPEHDSETGEERDSLRRIFDCKGRVPMTAHWETDYIDGYHQLIESGVPLDQQILRFIARNPGCSGRDIRTSVGGKTERITRTLNELEGNGLIQDTGTNGKGKWVTITGSLNGSGNHREPPSGTG